MRKLKLFTAFLVSACMSACVVAGFCACGSDETPPETLYKVSYAAGGGTGNAPAEKSYAEGTVIQLAQNPFTYEDHTFAGWSANDTVYAGGVDYTVPAHDTLFTATWTKDQPTPPPAEEPHPAFSQTSYSYDRIGGNDLELPFDLDGASFLYLEIDGDRVPPASVSYDTEKGCIVIKSDYILSLDEGDYTIKAITDAEEGETECALTIEQSLKTTFDETTTKAFVYGKEEGVTFTVGYNGTHAVRLQQLKEDDDPIEVDDEYWTSDATSFTVKGEWLAKNCDATEYRVYLSNNDSYTFTVTNNLLFATDYDVNTIHDTTASNIGHNSLYQYYSTVAIAQSPAAMNSGKALKLTPIAAQGTEWTEPLWQDLTITKSGDSKMWYKIPISTDKQYIITFDYLTENSDAAEGNSLLLKIGSTAEELLIGEENDGILHHHVKTFSGSDFGFGLSLHAQVVDGTVWVDNVKITEVDALPRIAATEAYEGSGDYSDITLEANGFLYKILLDGKEVESSLDGTTLTIPEKELQNISIGAHTLALETAFGALATTEFRVTDNRVSEITETSKDYKALDGEDLALEGNFSETLEITSLHVVDRNFNSGFDGWDFFHYNEEKEYKEFAHLTCGLDGTGKLTLDAELLAKFCGETKFTIEFDNGNTQEFTINVTDIAFASTYDDILVRGYLNGVASDDGAVLNSGLRWNGVRTDVKERDDDGGKAFFVYATKDAQDRRAYTFRYSTTNPGHEWYTMVGDLGELIRIKFDYRLPSDVGATYFEIGSTGEDKIFGNYTSSAGNLTRYELISDGQVHSFDSGWFVHEDGVTTSVFLAEFTESAGRYAMFDNVFVYKVQGPATVAASLLYDQGAPTEAKIALNGKTVKSVKLDDKAIGYDSADDAITLKQSELNELETGKHAVLIETNDGFILCSLMIRSGDAKLTETSKTVKYGESGDVKLAGKFKDGLKITEIRRAGEYAAYDTNPMMDISYIAVAADGLTISRKLIDQVYKTCTYTVTFDNEETVTFSLTSDLLFYTNYDETCLYEPGSGNAPLCQDTAMIKIAKDTEGNGSHLEYRPADATLGHSSNPAQGDNFALTFNTVFNGGRNWFQLNSAATGKLKVFFKYKITGNDKDARFIFVLLDGGTQVELSESYDEHGNATGTFSYEFNLSGVSGLGVRCRANSLDECQGCVLELDDFGIAYSAE